MVTALTLAGRVIGPGQPCFVIAEAGVNHNGDVALAHALIDAAADAGADAVKFQTFEPAALASPQAGKAEYQAERTGAGESQQAMLARLVLPQDAYPALISHARERGLIFLSTPFDSPSADFLGALALPAIKVASGELTNLPFLEALARQGAPMLLSTGMGTLAEVADAVAAIRRAGNPPLALLHCVSCYPAAPQDCNLTAMATLQNEFHIPVGWSDHTLGIEVSLAAVALGAAVVEKHLTLDSTMPGPDHAASLEPEGFRQLVSGIRYVQAALGDGVKQPVAAEAPIAAVARKSLHWAIDREAGAAVKAADLVAMRPGTGVSPAQLPAVVGRRTVRAVRAGDLLSSSDWEPSS